MLLQEYLNDTHEFASPEQWGVVQSNIPQQWIEQALQMTGVATLRKRRLPMEQALWLVLGVALLRDRSIVNVAEVLELALPGQHNEPISSSALSQARQRLGSEPCNGCFATLLPIGRTSRPLATAGKAWRCTHWMAWSGVPRHTRQPPALWFASATTQTTKVPSPGCMACLLVHQGGSFIGRYQPGCLRHQWYALAERLWPQVAADLALVIVDKGFTSAGLLQPLQHRQDITG